MVMSRAVHLATCLLIFGMDAFAILILPATLSQTLAWRRRRKIVLWCALPLLVISGAAWLMLVTIGITDPPLTEAGMRLVWSRTHFGRLWQLRSILAIAIVALEIVGGANWLRPIPLLLSAAMLASIAWSGHGQLDAWPNIHLANDIVHLLVAGLWPTGLLPLALILTDRSAPPVDAMNLLIRFSRMSVICVGVLVASGIVNALVTFQHPADLIGTRYGAVLIGKVGVVAMMIWLGAINRRSIKCCESPSIVPRVLFEIALSSVVILATAWLGTLEP